MAEAKRRLAAILAADVVGYSRLMGDDERATLEILNTYRDVFRHHIAGHEGRVVDTAGDSVLAVFDSVVEAVQCANEVQSELGARNENLPDDRRMLFRIGVNLGDVIEQDDGTIYGDGVNVAARLESLAEPGGITVSEAAYMQVEGKIGLGFQDVEEHEVKNIARPVRAFRIVATASKPAVSSRYAVPLTDQTPSLPASPSIAVLPFTNMSGDSEQEYFSDGITEDIIAALSAFPDFLVTARNTTFQYKGRAVDVKTLGAELNVRFVLEGSVRRSRNRLRITAQLIDTESDVHVWSETFDRDLTAADLFDIQDDITEQVSGALGDTYGIISRYGHRRSLGKDNATLEAYECVLAAHGYYGGNFGPEEHARVRDRLEWAVKAAPNYADAWAWLAGTYRDEHMNNFNPRPNPLDRAEAAARRALELDGSSREARIVMSYVHFFRHDLDSFLREMDRLLAIAPNSADALASAAYPLALMGQWDRAKALTEKAIRLNPDHPPWMRAVFYLDWLHRGDYEKALDEAHKSFVPDLYWSYVYLATVYGKLDRTAEAAGALDGLRRLVPDLSIEKMVEIHRKWNYEDRLLDEIIDGLRKAGVPG